MRPCLLLLSGLVGFAIVNQAQFTFAQTDPIHYDLLVNPAAGIAAAKSKSHNNYRRAFTTNAFHQTTLVTRAKILPPQQTLYLGAEEHTIKIPKDNHVWAGAIKFSPRSTAIPQYSVNLAEHVSLPPGVYTVEALHADLRRRSIGDASCVDKISPVVHAEEDTVNQGMDYDSTIHEVENTGNPRIPFVMPRPPTAVNRKYKSTADKFSRNNPKATEPQLFTYNNISVLPSLIVPVHERFPNREYGDPYHNEHDKHTVENKEGNRFGIEVAYDLPANNASYCALEFLYPEVPGSTHILNGSTTYTIYGYKYGAGSVSKWDTWNKRPQVHRNLVFGNIVANTTGIFIDGGTFSCNKNSGQAAFFIEALNEDPDAEIKIAAHSPNSLVVRMYGRGDWLENYGDASHVIFPPEVPNRVIPRNEIPKTLNGTEEVEESYAVIFGMIAYGSEVYNDDV